MKYTMGSVQLELRCPQIVDTVVAEPVTDWSFDELLSELNSLELKLNASSCSPVSITKTKPQEFSSIGKIDKCRSPFVMRVSDVLEDVDKNVDEVHSQNIFASGRFAFHELYISDDDDYEDELAETSLMNKVDMLEGALVELCHERQLEIRDEIMNHMTQLESNLIKESEELASSMNRIEKYIESRCEMDKKLDIQYQRKIAEGLDIYLTAVQRDHEQLSQIEESKIKNDAAIEDTERKERVIQEEKLRREKAIAEAELLATKKKAEELKVAAFEAERKNVKEAAEKTDTRPLKGSSIDVVKQKPQLQKSDPISNDLHASPPKGSNLSLTAGKLLRSSNNALKLEEIRIQKYNDLDSVNRALKSGSSKAFQSYERQITRLIKQISGTKETLRTKANELINIFNDPLCPQSISIAIFVQKVIYLSENPKSAPFALGHIIVLVTSKFPHAMDLILAEFHRACIYTVPKHITYSEAMFGTADAYKKMIGYREQDGDFESHKTYLERLESHMSLYGAIIQTEIAGLKNIHGLEEGWAWLARLLNSLPANIYTAVSLDAFLKVAGFGLFRRYKSQFRKIVKIISGEFVGEFKRRNMAGLDMIICSIESYIETEQFLREPEGWNLPSSVLSTSSVPTSDYADPYSHHSQRYHY